MNLEATTLIIVGCFIAALQGILLIWFWRREGAPALAVLGLAFLVTSLGRSCVLFADRQSAVMAEFIGESIILFGYGLGWQAARIFEHRPFMVFVPVIPPLLLVVAHLAGLPPALISRMGFVLMVKAVAWLLAAAELWRGRADPLRSRPLFVSLLIIVALATAGWGAVPFLNIAVLPADDPLWATLFFLFDVSWGTAIAYLALALTKERAEADHGRRTLADPSTGLLARGPFTVQANKEVYRCASGNRPVSLILFQIENSDPHEESADETFLKRLAWQVVTMVRSGDLVCRLGRDGIACLLSDRSHSDAMAIGERARRKLLPLGRSRPIRLLAGVASSTQVGHDLRALMTAAAAAVEGARRGEGDGVILFHPALAPGLDLHSAEKHADEGAARIIPFASRKTP